MGQYLYPNLNQAYMAGLMVVPLAILELLLMGAMNLDKRLQQLWQNAARQKSKDKRAAYAFGQRQPRSRWARP